jgi:hypothetical protein
MPSAFIKFSRHFTFTLDFTWGCIMVGTMNMKSLVEKIQSHADFNVPKGAWVSVYNGAQHYGGPEEGGWWYNRNTLVGSIYFPTMEQAEAWLEKAKVEVERENHENAPERHRAMASLPGEECDTAYHDEGFIPTGWDDGGELWVTIEDQRGVSDNSAEPRPHYE